MVVLETADGLRSLEPVAIEYEKGHEFDFAARYTAEFVSLNRPDLPEELIDRLGEVARQAHRTLGLRDVSRSDFIVSADGSFVVLETAITPGPPRPRSSRTPARSAVRRWVRSPVTCWPGRSWPARRSERSHCRSCRGCA